MFKWMRMQGKVKFLPHRTKFITNPPITTMSVGWTQHWEHRASLQVTGGIRICHLIEAAAKIRASWNAADAQEVDRKAGTRLEWYGAGPYLVHMAGYAGVSDQQSQSFVIEDRR
jgi:hypothetical protein